MKRFKSCGAYGAFEYIIVAVLIVLSALIVFNNVKGKGGGTLLNKAEDSSKAFIDSSISEIGVNIEVPSVPGEVVAYNPWDSEVGKFTAIAKTLGYTALTKGAAQSTYDKWIEYAPEMQSELANVGKEGTEIYTSRALLENIQSFINDGGIIIQYPFLQSPKGVITQSTWQSLPNGIIISPFTDSRPYIYRASPSSFRIDNTGANHHIDWAAGPLLYNYTLRETINDSYRVELIVNYYNTEGIPYIGGSVRVYSHDFLESIGLIATVGASSHKISIDSPTWKKRESEYIIPLLKQMDDPQNAFDSSQMPNYYIHANIEDAISRGFYLVN